MADLGKQFLDTDGLNALWTKHKKVQPFYQEIGTSGTNGWVNFLTVKGTTYMNHPLVVRLLCRGYSDSTMDVQFVSANNTTPTIQYFKQRIQPYSGTHAIAKPGYTYEDVDGVRYYKFWLKKNEGYGSVGVHVESEYLYTNGAEDTGILTFPNVQSDTEPSGIVYVANSDIVYETVPAKTAVSAAAVKVGTNALGQVVLGNALTKSDVGLGNVDNTSDANKPISTATQTALDGKVSKSGDTMTGQLINTKAMADSIKVSHGTANTDASIIAERTDVGVGVRLAVGGGGSNHGIYSSKNSNWIIKADTSGNVTVNDGKAGTTIYLGNTNVGAANKPMYLASGKISEGSLYAGGTAVTLNGTSASGSTASFYAPTSAGTNRRFLRANGSGAPSWYIPAADYTFNSVMYVDGDTKVFWAFRLKGITNDSYNNILLSIDTYFWNNQKSSSDLIWIGWSNNGNQGMVVTSGRFRIRGNDNSTTPLEYYVVKNTADTAAACTVDIYIRPSTAGNSYGMFCVNVLNSGNRDLDDIIEKKGTYNVALPTTAAKIPYTGTIGSADKLSTARELAVGLGNTSTTTKFDGSADVTNIRVTGTLPIANGGTGATTKKAAEYAINGGMAEATAALADNFQIVFSRVGTDQNATNGVFIYRQASTVWNYMKGKMSSDTGVNISGNAATATSAGKLTTARELAVSLSNTSTTTTFDGSANVTNIKVSGTLPVANGGTGSTTAAGARTNLSVYSKSEVDSLMSGRIEVVTALPSTGQSGIIYYVGPTGSGADKYDEYIWTGSAFIKVGEHSLDLSNYVNTVTTSGSGSVVTGVSKSGNTVTVTKGNISLDDLSDWATETDVTISNVTYHTMWPVAPTSSNQVYGISINGGRLFRIYNNKGTYSAQAYDKDSDTTYTPQKLGIGYGNCTTAEATAAKVVTLTDYVLVTNGIVAVKFSYPLCASATLNINGKGAKPVYIGGAAVTATNCKSVQAGDIGYFIYDGTAYHFLGTDRVGKSSITGLSVSGKTVTYTRADGETGSFDTQDTTYAFADSYNASTNKGATVATVTNAINALDVSDISGFGAGKTLATLTETNGKIAATFQNISITKSQVSDFSHAHGNIQNGGTLQTNDITIANGDKLVVTDASDSNKVARASLTFDGATTNQMLSKKGEWSDTIAKARAVVDYGSTSNAIEIGWSGAGVTSPAYFAVYTDSANGYSKAIKDCSLANVKKVINGTSVGSTAVPVFINANGAPQVCTDDFVHDGDVTSTYSSTGTAPVNGTAVASAISSSISGKLDRNNTSTVLIEPSQTNSGVYLILGQYSCSGYKNGSKIDCYSNASATITIESRHSGCGTCVISSQVNNSVTPTESSPSIPENSYTGHIYVYGNKLDSARNSQPIKMYRKYTVNAETGIPTWTITLIVNCGDYNNFKIANILHRNGVTLKTGSIPTYAADASYYVTSANLSTLGTEIASAQYLDHSVTQTADNSSTGTGYEVLFSATADNTTRTEGARKSNKLTFQPSTGTLTATKFSGELAGNASTASAAQSGSALETAINGKSPTSHTHTVKINGTEKTIAATGGTAVDLGSFLPLAGGTMTGKITAWGSKYTDDGTTGAIDMQNSNIVGLNSIYTKDASENASEGIHFYRDATHTDTLWMAGGHLYFVPNRTLAGSSASTSAADSKKVAILPASITSGQVVITDGTSGDVKGVDASTLTVGVASKLGTADKGSTTKPIYLAAGVPTECTTYAGGTAVTLNNASKAGSTASFYAPTAGGTANYVLIGNGTTSAPTWAEKAPKAVVADYPAGFSSRTTSWTWGTLTTANGYTQVTDWHTSNGSDISFAEKSDSGSSQALSVQIDGKFYQNEGQYRVLDTSNVSVPTTVPTLAWNTESTLATIDGKNIKVKLPASPDTDTKQNITLATTTKAFITGVSTTPTSTAQALTGLADTGVYLTTTAGELNATQYKVNEHCTMKYNSTKSSLDFTFS